MGINVVLYLKAVSYIHPRKPGPPSYGKQKLQVVHSVGVNKPHNWLIKATYRAVFLSVR